MRNAKDTIKKNLVIRQLSALLAMAIVLSCLQTAQAQTATFRLGENANVVRAAIDLERGNIDQFEYDDIVMYATCQNPYARAQDRNRPFLAVINTSDTDDEVTSVKINLEEAGFEFGNGDQAGDGFEGLLSMLSNNSDPGVQLTSASYGADNTELEISFSGLSPGQAAIFRVDLDEPSSPMLYPDYREAFQGANEGFGRDGDLARLSATFSSGDTVNAIFPKLGRLITAGRVEDYHAQTMSPVEQSMVPEPTSLSLLVAGVCGLGAVRRRR